MSKTFAKFGKLTLDEECLNLGKIEIHTQSGMEKIRPNI